MENRNIFISYSWDNLEHKEWVLNLANQLSEYEEIHVTLDQYDLDTSVDKNYFMEKGAFDSDIILIIITPNYAQKSNNRSGGVGIEATLLSSRYWDEILVNQKTSIIPILRAGEFSSSPRYLKNHFSLDFRNDLNFDDSFNNLLMNIKKEHLAKRPEKKKSLQTIVKNTDFTRCEDIIKINHKRRRQLFTKSESTNFTKGKRIKFELWEVLSPTPYHFLYLFDNINIKETIDHLCLLLKNNEIKVKNLTVLRSKKGDAAYLVKALNGNDVYPNIEEITLSDYLWTYCIDDELKRKRNIYQNPLFIDQDITKYEYDDEGNIIENNLGPGSESLYNILMKDTQSSVKIITAPGGTGKTTLCHNLFKKLSSESDVLPILIQAEAVKTSTNEGFRESISVENIFDLYQVYSRLNGTNSSSDIFSDKNTFELALLTGKIIVIIDGMDEFISLFHQKFNLENFFSSVVSLNKEIAQSKILITSRDDIFNEKYLLEKEDIEKFKLHGFNKEACDKYLQKKFKGLSNPEKYVSRTLELVKPITDLSEDNERILPFIIETFATQIYDSKENLQEISHDSYANEKQYASANGVVDYFVFSVIKRELTRQRIDLQISDIMNFFIEFCSYPSNKFSRSDISEYFEIMHNDVNQYISSKIVLNPLIEKVSQSDYSLKYDFLGYYFKSLFLIKQILIKSTGDSFIKIMANNAYGDSETFHEALKYFKSNKELFLENTKHIFRHLTTRKEEFPHNDEQCKRATSFLINMLACIPEYSSSKETFSDKIKELIGNENKIENIGIYGLTVPMDFKNIAIWKSKFVQYAGFYKSTFSDTRFLYCEFDRTPMITVPDSFNEEMFENCILGDLSEAIEQKKSIDELTANTIHKELIKFFTCFYTNSSFIDQKIQYMKFSNKVKKINKSFVDILFKEKILSIRAQKSDETYYQVSTEYQDSIYRLISSESIDNNIRKIISFLK